MRLIRFTTAAAIACLLIAGAGTSLGAPTPQTIPYIQTFESFANAAALTNETTGWTQGATEGELGISTTEFMEGAKAAYVGTTSEEGSLKLSIDTAENYGNVWCRLVVKPTLCDNDMADPNVGTDTFAAFFIKSNKEVRAYSGTDWATVGTVSGDSDDWRTLIVHAQYSGSTWDIYESTPDLNGTSWDVYQSKASRRVNEAYGPIAKNTAYTETKMASLEIKGAKTIIDAVAIAQDHQTPAQSRSNVVVTTVAGLTTNDTQVDLPLLGYADSEDALDQLLGTDLLYWLADGDRLSVRVGELAASNSTFYVTDVPDWDPSGDENPANVGAAHLTLGTAAWIGKAPSTSGPLVCFADYNTARTTQTGDTKELGGDATEGAQPWNSLVWPKDTEATLEEAGITGTGPNGAQPGDLIYMRWDGKVRRIYRNSSNTAWMLGASVFNGELGPKQSFWYYRKGESRPWNIPE